AGRAPRRHDSGTRSGTLLLPALLMLGFGRKGTGSPNVQLNGAQPRPFYVMAHNPNTLQDADDAVANGCNALEPDITEVTCNGQEILIDFDSDLGVIANTCGQTRLEAWC